MAELPDPVSEATSIRMRATRQRDTAPELKIRRELHRRGLRYYVDRAPLPNSRRRADIVFPRARVAVYVHGCYWHGCEVHGTVPKRNTDFWMQKIDRNRERDAETRALLLGAGWTTVEIWEHEDVMAAVERIQAALTD